MAPSPLAVGSRAGGGIGADIAAGIGAKADRDIGAGICPGIVVAGIGVGPDRRVRALRRSAAGIGIGAAGDIADANGRAGACAAQGRIAVGAAGADELRLRRSRAKVAGQRNRQRYSCCRNDRPSQPFHQQPPKSLWDKA